MEAINAIKFNNFLKNRSLIIPDENVKIEMIEKNLQFFLTNLHILVETIKLSKGLEAKKWQQVYGKCDCTW